MKNLSALFFSFMLIFAFATNANAQVRTQINPAEQIRPGNDLEILQTINGKPSWEVVTFPADGDGDSANEIQTFTDNGDGTYTLSNGGGTISNQDADSDVTNELQTFTDNGDGTFTLSNGGGTISNQDADSDVSNELQTFTDNGDGTYTLSNGGGTISNQDADSDVTNELQTISTPDDFTAELSNSGGQVTVINPKETVTGLTSNTFSISMSLPTNSDYIQVSVNGLPEVVGQAVTRSGQNFTYYRNFQNWEQVEVRVVKLQ